MMFFVEVKSKIYKTQNDFGQIQFLQKHIHAVNIIISEIVHSMYQK